MASSATRSPSRDDSRDGAMLRSARKNMSSPPVVPIAVRHIGTTQCQFPQKPLRQSSRRSGMLNRAISSCAMTISSSGSLRFLM